MIDCCQMSVLALLCSRPCTACLTGSAALAEAGWPGCLECALTSFKAGGITTHDDHPKTSWQLLCCPGSVTGTLKPQRSWMLRCSIWTTSALLTPCRWNVAHKEWLTAAWLCTPAGAASSCFIHQLASTTSDATWPGGALI